MTFKQVVKSHYQQLVQDRIDAFQDMITALAEDSRNDAKGSAGDKHETSLAMMHIEQEKLNRKLAEFYHQKSVLDKIDPLIVNPKVAVGSLVVVNGMLVYISAALPKAVVQGKSVIAVSPEAPLGSNMIGKQPGSEFEVNGTKYLISEVH